MPKLMIWNRWEIVSMRKNCLPEILRVLNIIGEGRAIIGPLQDYLHDMLSRIVSRDAICDSVIDVDSCSHDSGGRPFKISKADHVGRSIHLGLRESLARHISMLCPGCLAGS